MAASVTMSRSPFGASENVAPLFDEVCACLAIIRGECHGLVRHGLASGARFERLRIIDHQAERIAAAMDAVHTRLCDEEWVRPEIVMCRLDHIVVCAVGRLCGVAQACNIELAIRSLDESAILGQREMLDRVVEHVLIRAISTAKPSFGVGIRLGVHGQTARLCVSSRQSAPAADHQGDDVGRLIVRSHIERLGGTVDQTRVGDRVICRLVFPLGAR
jgi:hypothetical protein